MHRRRFLRHALAAPGLMMAGGALSSALAQAPGGKRFLFVHAVGGWDPLCAFAPLYGRPGIDMEPDSELSTVGDIPLVDSPRRPAVRRFFDGHGARTLVLNGVSVRSVNHETCQAVALTGSTSDRKPDWATLLATAGRGRFDLPHLVFSGPVFAGPHTVMVSRAQGALGPLLDGRLLRQTQPGVEPLGAPAGRLVDRFLAGRAEAIGAAAGGDPMLVDLAEASRRARRLSDRRFEIALEAGPDLASGMDAAVGALASGICRCASVDAGGDWDTHVDNGQQSGLYERLFTGLERLMGTLATTPGPQGRPLADDTLVVVVSEMARTPAYNGTGGRDHWPYTSLMIAGPGITGGRVIGGYDDGFIGVGVRPEDGALDPAQPGISSEDVGATLLALGDVDPASVLPFARPIVGVMA